VVFRILGEVQRKLQGIAETLTNRRKGEEAGPPRGNGKPKNELGYSAALSMIGGATGGMKPSDSMGRVGNSFALSGRVLRMGNEAMGYTQVV